MITCLIMINMCLIVLYRASVSSAGYDFTGNHQWQTPHSGATSPSQIGWFRLQKTSKKVLVQDVHVPFSMLQVRQLICEFHDFINFASLFSDRSQINISKPQLL